MFAMKLTITLRFESGFQNQVLASQSDQSQQMQIMQWTNQNLNQKHATGAKHGKTSHDWFCSDWLRTKHVCCDWLVFIEPIIGLRKHNIKANTIYCRQSIENCL